MIDKIHIFFFFNHKSFFFPFFFLFSSQKSKTHEFHGTKRRGGTFSILFLYDDTEIISSIRSFSNFPPFYYLFHRYAETRSNFAATHPHLENTGLVGEYLSATKRKSARRAARAPTISPVKEVALIPTSCLIISRL